jgi:hypothetical protein
MCPDFRMSKGNANRGKGASKKTPVTKQPRQLSTSDAAIRARLRRFAETPAQKTRRLEQERRARLIKREEETPEDREARLSSNAARNRGVRSRETPEAIAARLATDVARHRYARAHETTEQRVARLLADAARGRIKREQETSDERTARLRRARLARPVRKFTVACMRRHVGPDGRGVHCGSIHANHNELYEVGLVCSLYYL